jgi:hypothetical protein
MGLMIDVHSTWYPNGKWRVNKVTLPEGETSIHFDYEFWKDNTSVVIKMNDIELRYNFEAGKEYTIAGYLKTGFLDPTNEYGVGIWDRASWSAFPPLPRAPGPFGTMWGLSIKAIIPISLRIL